MPVEIVCQISTQRVAVNLSRKNQSGLGAQDCYKRRLLGHQKSIAIMHRGPKIRILRYQNWRSRSF